MANSLRQVLVFSKYFLPSSSRVCTFVVLFSIYFCSFLFLFIGLGARLAKGLRRSRMKLVRFQDVWLWMFYFHTMTVTGCSVVLKSLQPHSHRHSITVSIKAIVQYSVPTVKKQQNPALFHSVGCHRSETYQPTFTNPHILGTHQLEVLAAILVVILLPFNWRFRLCSSQYPVLLLPCAAKMVQRCHLEALISAC